MNTFIEVRGVGDGLDSEFLVLLVTAHLLTTWHRESFTQAQT